MLEDSRGRFWVGDQMGAMRLVDRQTGAVSLQVDGHAAYEDREGNVWFGTPPPARNELSPMCPVRTIDSMERETGLEPASPAWENGY